MHYIQVIIVAALAALSVSGNTASAQEDGGASDAGHKPWGRHRGPGRGMPDPEEVIGRMAKHLELDDAQSQSVENIMAAARPRFNELRERAHQNRQAIRSLDPAAPNYATELQSLAAENGELAAELTLLTGQLRGDVHGVLTPEQQEKMAAFVERRAERAGDGRRRAGGRENQ